LTDEILKFTKITFLIHFLLGIVFTVLFWLPEVTGPLFGLSYTDEMGALSMLIGALFLGLTIGSLFGFLAKEWKEVKIVAIIESFWLVAGLIAMTINLSVYNAMIYVSLVINIILLVLFCLTFLQQEDKIKPLF